MVGLGKGVACGTLFSFHIASYPGLERESLSRLRKKIAGK